MIEIEWVPELESPVLVRDLAVLFFGVVSKPSSEHELLPEFGPLDERMCWKHWVVLADLVFAQAYSVIREEGQECLQAQPPSRPTSYFGLARVPRISWTFKSTSNTDGLLIGCSISIEAIIAM